jgi:hypothetical protein
VFRASSFQCADFDGVSGIGTPALSLAGVIANMSENEGQGNSIRQNCEAALEVTARYALDELARIHVCWTGGGAGGRLLLNALRLPPPNLFPIHDSISRHEAISQELIAQK